MAKITKQETVRRTKNMVALDTGLKYAEISVRQDLANDLNYSTQDKKDLKGLIDGKFFEDVNASADKNDLAKTTTVGDLASRIFNNYIQPSRREK